MLQQVSRWHSTGICYKVQIDRTPLYPSLVAIILILRGLTGTRTQNQRLKRALLYR